MVQPGFAHSFDSPMKAVVLDGRHPHGYSWTESHSLPNFIARLIEKRSLIMRSLLTDTIGKDIYG